MKKKMGYITIDDFSKADGGESLPLYEDVAEDDESLDADGNVTRSAAHNVEEPDPGHDG